MYDWVQLRRGKLDTQTNAVYGIISFSVPEYVIM